MNPQMACGGHATLANNRFGWVNMEATATTDNAAAVTDYDAYPNPAHAFVTGRGTDMFFLEHASAGPATCRLRPLL